MSRGIELFCGVRISALPLNLLRPSSRGLYLALGSLGEFTGLYHQGALKFTVTEDFDRLSERGYQTSLNQLLRSYLCTLFKYLQLLQINYGIFGLENIREAALAGQTFNQRSLAALKPQSNPSSGTGFLSLQPTTRVSSMSAPVTSPDALSFMFSPRAGL